MGDTYQSEPADRELPDDELCTIGADLPQWDRVEALAGSLEALDGREQRVLRLRFGLDDGQTRTLEEVGKELGVSRERIRQIEVKALRKLRHPSRRELKDFGE